MKRSLSPMPAFSTAILKEIIEFAFANGWRPQEPKSTETDISDRPTLIPGTTEGDK